MKNYGIILASGTGSRYGADIPKQFIKIVRKTMLERAIDAFENAKEIDEIIVVITPQYRQIAQKILQKNKYKKITALLNGGETRKDSSFIGISAIKEDEANVLIHDCARPFLTNKIISDCVKTLEEFDAVGVAIPVTDTIIEVDDNLISNIPNRARLQKIQTPQCFKLSLIKKAHEIAKGDKNFTDDCGLIAKYNLAKIRVVEGDIDNIKITYPSDIFLAEKIFKKRKSENSAHFAQSKKTIAIFCLIFLFAFFAILGCQKIYKNDLYLRDCKNNLEKAQEIAAFKFPVVLSNFQVKAAKDLIEVTYPLDEFKDVSVRKSTLNNDNIIDINRAIEKYPTEDILSLQNGVEVLVRKNEKKIYLAYLAADSGYYSIFCPKGLEKADIWQVYKMLAEVEGE